MKEQDAHKENLVLNVSWPISGDVSFYSESAIRYVLFVQAMKLTKQLILTGISENG